jgi:arylsulfatase A
MTQNECVSNIVSPGSALVAGINANYSTGPGKIYGACPIFNGSTDRPAEQYNMLATPPRLYDMNDVDEQYDYAAASFIRAAVKKKQSFFFYFASHHTHVPQFGGIAETGYTLRGLQGDSLSLLDRSVGRVTTLLDDLGIANETLFVFSADNGGARYWGPDVGGVNGELACGKATNWEGGHRVPTMVRWPGVVRGGSVNQQLIASLDWYPTIAKLAGFKLTPGVVYDGVENSAAILLGGAVEEGGGTERTSRRTYFPYYSSHLKRGPGVLFNASDAYASARMVDTVWPPLMAVRDRQFKLHVFTYGVHRPSTGRRDWAYRDATVCAAPLQNWQSSNMSCTGFGPKQAGSSPDPSNPASGPGCTLINRSAHTSWREPLLFDLLKDPGENVPRTPLENWDGGWPAPQGWHSGSMPAAEYAQVVTRLMAEFEREKAAMPFVESRVQIGTAPTRFPCCNPGCTPLPHCCTCDTSH